MKKVQKRKKFFIISCIVIALLFVSGCVLTFVYLRYFFEEDYSDYEPKFENYDWEYAEGIGLGRKIFYKTNEDYSIGDAVDDFTFISANTLNAKVDIVEIENIIDRVEDGYIVFDLEANFISDCLAFYKGTSLFKDWYFVRLGFLPVPSDSYFCEGFDFENYMKDPEGTVEKASVRTARKFIEELYPKFLDWQNQESFAGKTIEYVKEEDVLYLAYVTQGSGVGVVEATCFSVDEFNQVEKNGELEKPSLSKIDPKTCSGD